MYLIFEKHLIVLIMVTLKCKNAIVLLKLFLVKNVIEKCSEK